MLSRGADPLEDWPLGRGPAVRLLPKEVAASRRPRWRARRPSPTLLDVVCDVLARARARRLPAMRLSALSGFPKDVILESVRIWQFLGILTRRRRRICLASEDVIEVASKHDALDHALDAVH